MRPSTRVFFGVNSALLTRVICMLIENVDSHVVAPELLIVLQLRRKGKIYRSFKISDAYGLIYSL